MHAYPLKALERMQMDRKTVFEAACTAFATTVTAYAASCACEMFAGTVELHGAKRGARVTGTSADGVPFWWWHRE